MMLQQDLSSHRKRLMIQTELMDRNVGERVKNKNFTSSFSEGGKSDLGKQVLKWVYFLDNKQVKPWGSVAF